MPGSEQLSGMVKEGCRVAGRQQETPGGQERWQATTGRLGLCRSELKG